jgi:hypothetical protein
MQNALVDRQNLEIAIQTVLHQYKSELDGSEHPQQDDLIKEMAVEISRKARLFQALSEQTATLLEVDGR